MKTNIGITILLVNEAEVRYKLDRWNRIILHHPTLPCLASPTGYKEFRFDGLLHNTRGPAILPTYGDCTYAIHGIKLTKEEFENAYAS